MLYFATEIDLATIPRFSSFRIRCRRRQRDGLAAADDAADRNQAPLHDRALDVLDELLVVLGVMVARLEVEVRAHIAELAAHKRRARHHRGINWLKLAAPVSTQLLTRAAERGGNYVDIHRDHDIVAAPARSLRSGRATGGPCRGARTPCAASECRAPGARAAARDAARYAQFYAASNICRPRCRGLCWPGPVDSKLPHRNVNTEHGRGIIRASA